MFKLIDRGVLEAFGSTAITKNLMSTRKIFSNLLESGSLYAYATFQFVVVLSFLFVF